MRQLRAAFFVCGAHRLKSYFVGAILMVSMQSRCFVTKLVLIFYRSVRVWNIKSRVMSFVRALLVY